MKCHSQCASLLKGWGKTQVERPLLSLETPLVKSLNLLLDIPLSILKILLHIARVGYDGVGALVARVGSLSVST